MTYGVVPEGFSRKPLAVVLQEIENALMTEFGTDFIQTAQSPMGQINGVMSDYIDTLWQLAEHVYQSHDVDQAEARRLEILGKLRLLRRGIAESDIDFRRAITNQGRARIDVQDIARAVRSVEGVTYSQVFVNDTINTDENLLPPASIAVAAIGGDSSALAAAMRQYIVPGITTYGTEYVNTIDEGYCRSMAILRPIIINPEVTVNIRVMKDRMGCPPPSATAIRDYLVATWNATAINGQDLTHFTVRSLIESQYPNVEVINIIGKRAPSDVFTTTLIDISFIELAQLLTDRVTVDEID